MNTCRAHTTSKDAPGASCTSTTTVNEQCGAMKQFQKSVPNLFLTFCYLVQCNVMFGLVSVWHWSGISLSLVWCQSGNGLLSVWCQSGVGQVSVWCQSAVSLASAWCRSGISLVSVWHQSGVGLMSVWCQSGVSPV